MPERERTGRRVRGQIRDQPLVLWRAGGTGHPPTLVTRVQRDQVPTANVEAVVPMAAFTGDAGHLARPIEEVEVSGRHLVRVLVIAGDGVREGEELGAPPARAIE